MKRICILLFFILIVSTGYAQWNWYNPQQADYPVIQNLGWSQEISSGYNRLPKQAQKEVREDVWHLSRHSAGLAIHFYSNAPEIKIRYQVGDALQMPHMPATAVSGIDLYAINSDGEWMECAGSFSLRDTIQYHYRNIGEDPYHNFGYEYRLYLPLYNSVKEMEIGIPDGYSFEFIPLSPEKPIVLYGTSIAQGGCASRPGMAWSTILQRSVDYPLINLGFSGNGRLEPEVITLINEIDARLYILDCLPNLTTDEETEIYNRLTTSIRSIRSQHASPILLIEHASYSNMKTDSISAAKHEKVNRISLQAYNQLVKEGIQELYYLSAEEIALSSNGFVDTEHPTDLGMQIQANAVEKKVREILHIPVGTISTTIPVTQRREPHNYEWLKRHREILTYHQTTTPICVILGNSITHFWGGKPDGPRKSGNDSWEKYMEPQKFHNLGYGWDRIENVLWRVYHDELSGYQAEKIVLMIGTNNLGFNTEPEIVEGIRTLIEAIRYRQPSAMIKVMGILPRREYEDWVRNLNTMIKEMAEREGCVFENAGIHLLQTDGKINEAFFSDGLHPNEEGYRRIAPFF